MSRKCFPLIFYGMKGEWLSLSAFVFVIFHELKGEWFWLSACIMSCKCLTLLIFSRCEGWVAFLFSFHDVTRFLPPRVCIPSRCDHHGVIITVWRVSGFPCQLSWCHANASPSWFFSRCEGWVAFHVSFLSVAQITEVALCNKWSLWSTRLLTEVEVTPNITHGDDRIIWPLDFLDREQWSSF